MQGVHIVERFGEGKNNIPKKMEGKLCKSGKEGKWENDGVTYYYHIIIITYHNLYDFLAQLTNKC